MLKDLVRFNQILRTGIAKSDSPITVVQKILKAIGQKLPCLRNERDGKKRLRIYGAAVSRFGELHHFEDEILSGWLQSEKPAAYDRHKPYKMAEIEGSPHIVQPTSETLTQKGIQRLKLFSKAIAKI